MGERALLVQLPTPSAVLAAYADLRRAPLDDQVDLVPGAETLLVHFAASVRSVQVSRLRERIAALFQMRPGEPGERGASCAAALDGVIDTVIDTELDRVIDTVIDTVYDGADLDEVGRRTGLGPDGVIAAHTGTPWRVAFCGFAPGFGYLAGGDPRLRVSRRESPRVTVPAGSVGLADGYSGVYPRSSPGGWQLIGRTGAALWEPLREPPALLRPGMTVRFRSVRPSVTVSPGRAVAAGVTPAPSTSAGPALVVVKPGMQCTVQDLGRTGCAAMGVSPSGAADRGAAARANGLVGNPAAAAVLELLNGAAEFEARGDLVVAVTGATVALTVGGAPGTAAESIETDCAVRVPAGSWIRLGRPRAGLRSYLAVRGGIAVTPMLGSRSADTLAGLGPPPARAGDVLPIGSAGRDAAECAAAPTPQAGHDPFALAMLPGPQLDWLADAAIVRLTADPWVVSPTSGRVAVRLTGPRLERARTVELASQGLVRGAAQLTPSGELVVFLSDFPVTGGYPVIGILTEAAADRAAQLRPGARVRFRTARVRVAG